MQGLDEMAEHEDLAVRGGVKLAREYVQHLKDENSRLRHEVELRNEYLKKMKAEAKGIVFESYEDAVAKIEEIANSDM